MAYWNHADKRSRYGKGQRVTLQIPWPGKLLIGYGSGYWIDEEHYQKGDYAMVKKQDDPFTEDDWGMPSTQEGPSDEMPGPSTEERPPFLKPHHVGSITTGTLELVGVTGESSEFSDVVLLVKFRGKMFRLGMRLFAPEYKALNKRFGSKRSDWHGELRYKVLPHKGNPQGYVAVR